MKDGKPLCEYWQQLRQSKGRVMQYEFIRKQIVKGAKELVEEWVQAKHLE
jgi:hypothetical protein